MADVLIIYHSQSGANEALARAAYIGALKCKEASVLALRADEACSHDMIDAKTILFCFAEMNSTMAGSMKALLDRTFYPLIESEKVLSVAVCMSVGNDGSGALNLFKRISQGLNVKWLAEPYIVKGEPEKDDMKYLEDTGQALSELAAMNIY